MERKYLSAIEAKLAMDDGAGSGEFVGYASTWTKDRQGDRIERGAFMDAIPSFLTAGFIPVGHDWMDEPVAMPLECSEDEYGLKIRAQFHSTEKAQSARTMVRERLANNLSVGLSIGFALYKDGTEIVDNGETRLIKRIPELYEVSIVTVPANPRALVSGAKSVSDRAQGMKLADHSEAVLATVDEFATRVKSLRDLRVKEGRVLSERVRGRLAGHCDSLRQCATDLDELLASTAPKPKDEDTAKQLILEAERLALELAFL